MAQTSSLYKTGSGGRLSWSKEISFHYISGKALKEDLRVGRDELFNIRLSWSMS